jgi:hypothetical protein
MKQSDNPVADLIVHVENDNCTVDLNGNMDILLQGVVGAINCIIDQLMKDYDEDDFDTKGMDEESFKFCTTAMVLSYIMDNFDCTITSMEQRITDEDEEDSITTNNKKVEEEINNNIQSLNFSAFGQEDNAND